MNPSRWGPAAGILFVVLYVAAWFVSATPDSDDSAADVAAFYADKTHRVAMLVATYLFIAAALLFLWFLVALRRRLLQAEGAGGPLAALSYGAGIVFVGLLIVGVFALAAVPGNISFGGADPPRDGDIVTTVQGIGLGLILIGGMLSAATAIVASAVLTLRTGALPRWTAWVGLAAAVALLFAFAWLPQLGLLVWVLGVSFAMLRRSSPRAAGLKPAVERMEPAA
jgi:hypothetical protein